MCREPLKILGLRENVESVDNVDEKEKGPYFTCFTGQNLSTEKIKISTMESCLKLTFDCG